MHLRTAPLVALASMVAIPLLAQSPDRSKPPVPGPVPSLKLPAIQRHTLTNGLPVWIVEMHQVPIVDISVIIKAGAAADPRGKYGTASYTAAMLDEGAGSRTALELAEAIDSLGATLTTSSTFDYSAIRLHTLTSKLDAALPILADVTIRPTFPASDMERLRTERVTGFVQLRDNPSALATAAFNRLLFGETHRYGTGAGGTEAATKAMVTADLREFHATFYHPGNAHILVVGDVSAATVLPRLEASLGGWQRRATATAASALVARAPSARQIVLVDKPGAAQSQIRIGTVGAERQRADYHAIVVANTLLGGSFSSRLNMNLREDKGYSYGASSAFQMRAAAGPFIAAAGVQTDKTVESLVEFFREFDRMGEPVPDDELTRARNLEALSFPGAFETTSAMAAQLIDMAVYDLPETFFNEYVSKIQAVSSRDVARIASAFMNAGTSLVVVVGDLAVIEQPIRAANLAPVSVVRVEDVLR